MESITYKVYENQNEQAIYIGDITAPDYETAEAFALSEGIKDFILCKVD